MMVLTVKACIECLTMHQGTSEISCIRMNTLRHCSYATFVEPFIV